VSERWPDAPELAEPPGEAEQHREEDEAPEAEVVAAEEPASEAEVAAEEEQAEHAAGDFRVPEGYGVLEGAPQGGRRAVGIVVSRFNGAVTSKLLDGALAELDRAGVARDAITVMPVPGAFELPIAAMALAKTRRYACIVALGCVIRGDTPHFDFVAGEAASGLQLAALETGVPVAFGVLTLSEADQADDRLEKGAEAVRTGLEMADVFAQLRAAAQR
jgi:6,7-dimethyl-8-ribityllumazine synthase